MELVSGQLIGIYRIVRLLGQGGMGAVYEVEHTQLGVHYALKAFTFEGGHDAILRNKFLAEGRVLARLNDPHLVRVFDLDFDEASGTLYFVMDLVLYKDGQPRTLADIETAELDEDYVLRWFAELAAALDYIHAQGIVHRDIKLGNILLNADYNVILSDFGISRFFSQKLKGEIDAVTTMVSEAGTGGRLVMGTQGYMAPEVARGEEATPAADVYSLGVMFVYLLTGIWYAPGSKVFRLLETLEYNWKAVLPRLLAENPADRPTCLAKLVEVVRQDDAALRRRGLPSASKTASTASGAGTDSSADADRSPRLRTRIFFRVFYWASAALVGVVVGYLIFAHRTAPIVSTAPAASAPTSSLDAFDIAFGAAGIYESPKK